MVFDVVRALGRRWYVVLVGLLLTAGMVYGAYKASPPEYNARALVLLLPSEAEVGRRGNPFLLLSGLEQPAGILAAYLSSASARAEVEELSPNAEYEVGLDDSTRGPVIVVDVTDETAMDTLKTLDHLLRRIPEELARMQQDVDVRESAVIGSMQLTVDRQPKADIRGTVRLMIAALVVGVVVTGVSAFAIDGLAQRRKPSRRSTDGARRTRTRTTQHQRRALTTHGQARTRKTQGQTTTTTQHRRRALTMHGQARTSKTQRQTRTTTP